MKIKLIPMLALGLLVGLSTTSLVSAKDKEAKGPKECSPKAGAMGDRMKERLGLTDEQAAKLKDLRESNQKEMRALQDKVQDETTAIKRKLRDGAGDSVLKPLLDKLQADHETLQAKRKANMDKMREILTPTQQAKMLVMMGRRMGPGGWGGRDGQWNHKDGRKGGDKTAPKDKDDDGPAKGKDGDE